MLYRQYSCAQRPLIYRAAFIAVLLLVMGSTLEVAGQENTASIIGTTADASGAAIPYTRVSVTNEDTGLERQATADREGRFLLPALPPGAYTLTAQRTGFSQVRITGLRLQAGINAKISVQFPPVVTLRGRVVDFQTTEPIAKVLVAIRDQQLQAITDENGQFEMRNVLPGRVDLYVSTVGYGLLKQSVELQAGVENNLELLVL